MNGKTLEMEPGTIGYEHLDCAAFNRALNAWAKRRGITWEIPFRKPLQFGRKKNTRPS